MLARGHGRMQFDSTTTLIAVSAILAVLGVQSLFFWNRERREAPWLVPSLAALLVGTTLLSGPTASASDGQQIDPVASGRAWVHGQTDDGTVALLEGWSDEVVPGDTNHQPIADSHRDCICLIATDAPLRFTGLMGRLMQPFIGL